MAAVRVSGLVTIAAPSPSAGLSMTRTMRQKFGSLSLSLPPAAAVMVTSVTFFVGFGRILVMGCAAYAQSVDSELPKSKP
jgi:hypothetical protein